MMHLIEEALLSRQEIHAAGKYDVKYYARQVRNA